MEIDQLGRVEKQTIVNSKPYQFNEKRFEFTMKTHWKFLKSTLDFFSKIYDFI